MSAPSRSRSRERTPSEKSSLGKVQPIAQAPVAEQEEAVSGLSGTPVGSGLPSAEGRNAEAEHHDSSGRSAPSSADANQEKFMVTPPSAAPGSTMPLVPAIPVPARTKVVVTVPVKMKVPPQASLQDVRNKLIAAGIPVESSKGSFHCRGEPEVVDDAVVGDLKDTRLAFFPEPDLQPWQLCAAHRACERLVQQRLGQNWAAARHPFFKTRLCNNWVQQGGCLRGARCVYAHGPGELQRAQVPPGFMPRPPGPSQPGGVKMPPPVKVPEVVFTVDKEEERRRAERAKRFAPRAASFEAKEAPPAQKSEDVSPEEVDIDEVDPEVGFINEEQIAEYLMEMQQQLLNSDDGGFDVDPVQQPDEMCDGKDEAQS